MSTGRRRPNPIRLARSLELLTRVNAWRMRRAAWPDHVAQELAYIEAQLIQHDADCRAERRIEQLTIFDHLERLEHQSK